LDDHFPVFRSFSEKDPVSPRTGNLKSDGYRHRVYLTAMKNIEEIKQAFEGSPEYGRETEDLLALASKVSQISNVDDLAEAFAEWLSICPESEGIVNVLHRHIVGNV